jgi:hypothetical protein
MFIVAIDPPTLLLSSFPFSASRFSPYQAHPGFPRDSHPLDFQPRTTDSSLQAFQNEHLRENYTQLFSNQHLRKNTFAKSFRMSTCAKKG